MRSLEEIRLKFNPINSGDTKENIREMFITRVERLKIFNRTPIEVNERKGAEIDYLKFYGKEWLELEEGKDSNGDTLKADELEMRKSKFHQEHPRFARLVESKSYLKITRFNVYIFINRSIFKFMVHLRRAN